MRLQLKKMRPLWLIASIPASLYTSYRCARTLFCLVRKLDQKTTKDFDIYYVSIFLTTLIISNASFIIKAVIKKDFLDVCNESFMQFLMSIFGGSMLQIAICWLEVTGMTVFFQREKFLKLNKKIFQIRVEKNGIFEKMMLFSTSSVPRGGLEGGSPNFSKRYSFIVIL